MTDPIGVPEPQRRPHFGPPPSATYRQPGRLKTVPNNRERQRVRVLTRKEQDGVEEVAEEIRKKNRQDARRKHHERLKADGWTRKRDGTWVRPAGYVKPPRKKRR